VQPLALRTAAPEEADALTRLALRSKRAWGYDDDFMRRVTPDMIVQREYLFVEHGIVAECDGRILGYATVRIDGATAFLHDLFVEPDRFVRVSVGCSLRTLPATLGGRG
jgi:hypothetical protein